MPLIVCDISTLIKIRKGRILKRVIELFEKAYLPLGVWSECQDPETASMIQAPFFEVREIQNVLPLGMGIGEREAIS